MKLRAPRSSTSRGRFRLRDWWVIALAAAVLSTFPFRSEAQSAPVRIVASGPGVIDRLPSDVQMILCIKDAQRQRRSAPGQAIVRALAGARFFSETGAAWIKLADLMEWEPEEAFVRLAGRRLVLAIAGQTEHGDHAWAILSDVDSDTERRLVSRLRPAPRKTVAGQPVLSLEDGRFEIAIFCPPQGAGKQPVAPCTIVLAPTGRGDLLDRIVRGLAGDAPGPVLGDAPAMKAALPLLGADLFFMGIREGKDGPQQLLLAAALADDGWTASLRASPGLLLRSNGPGAAIPPWSAQAVDVLASDAVALVMADSVLDLDIWAPLFLVPTLPEAAERLSGLLGRRRFLGVFRARNEDEAVPGVALALGLEAPDVAKLAAPADAVLGRLIGAIEAGSKAGDSDRPDFQGFLPEAPRVVHLKGPTSLLWRPLLGPRPTLTWVYRESVPAPASAEAPKPGWWLSVLAPSDRRSNTPAWATAACESLARPGPESDLRPRVSAGMVRVAELVRWLSDIQLDPTGSLVPLRCLDTVRWDAWMGSGGDIEGTLRITTTPVP